MNVTKNHTRYLTLGAMMVAITAICAQIMLPLPGTPVQFSLQVFAVLLTALLLPPRYALLSSAAYLLLGAVGAPVFGGFRGGPSVLFGATGGFLMVFPLVALWVSWGAKHFKVTKRLPLFLLTATSLPLCYAMGCLWFCVATGSDLQKALALAVLPFIVPDLLKAALAAWLAPVLIKRLGE